MRKSRKACALSSLKERWAKALKGTICHFESAVRHSKSAKWYSWMPVTLSCSGAFWTHFLGFLEPGLILRRVFNPYSRIFISFLESLFNNNYLVYKYSKINIDKVHIIHNFIVIQLSSLFLCKQSYFRH